MAAVLTLLAPFIFLFAQTCFAQGQTPTGMLHDSTCIPFVQCSATFTTELALTMSMEEVVNNVSLVSLSITEAKSTCSVDNSFSLCAVHDTSNSNKAATLKTFFPIELPRNASQFGCTVRRLYTSGPLITNSYLLNVTFERTIMQCTTQDATPPRLSLLLSSGVVSKNVFVSAVSVLGVLLAILIVIIIGLLVRSSRAAEGERDRNVEAIASTAATLSVGFGTSKKI